MAGLSSVVVVTLVAMVSYFQTTNAAFSGKLQVIPLDAMAKEQTDGWLGEPDLYIKVKAIMASKDEQQKKTEVIEIPVNEQAFFNKMLKFKGTGPWTEMQVTLIDRDKGEYGQTPSDDILIGPETIKFGSRRGIKKLSYQTASMDIQWVIKA